ncbi:MAG: RNA polymerase sigma factor [Clostridiales Family XIII bacterium]|jgi:RNA polymerase sigma-70 factor (ECF subfamily)|nr:RNA polymerase sigma factor [Clostridiales Family XIII bacterium]
MDGKDKNDTESNNKKYNLSLNNETTEIVLRAIAGDADAYEELIGKYSKYIFSLINGMTHISNVEDIAQEVAIAVFRNITTLKSPYAFTSWLRTLTVNVCRNYNDKEKRHTGMDVDMEQLADVSEDTPANLPEESFEKQNASALLYTFIDKLPKAQRQAVYLHYHEGLKYKEIASLLQISTATVGTNIIKAKNSLKKMIENNAGTKEDLLTSLRSAAIGPVIAGAFDYGVSAHVTEAALSKFGGSVMAKVSLVANRAPDQAVIGAMNAAKTAKAASAAKVAAVTTTFVVAAGGIGLYYAQSIEDTKPTPTPEPKPAAVEYEKVVYNAANAEIIFEVTGDKGKNVDPVSALLVVGDEEGLPQGWRITDGAGAEVAAGSGGSLDVPAGLAPGKYTVTYDVANEAGAVSKVIRDFYISE